MIFGVRGGDGGEIGVEGELGVDGFEVDAEFFEDGDGGDGTCAMDGSVDDFGGLRSDELGI